MPGVADVARALGHYGEFVGVVSVLPVMSHVKFGSIIRMQEEASKAREEEARKARGEAPQAEASPAVAAGAAEQERHMPPAWSLLLLLLAELSTFSQLFDPSDLQVRRAVGEVVRAQRKTSSGVVSTLKAAEKLLANADVFELVRFAAAVAGLGGLLLTSTLELDRLDLAESRSSNPLRHMAHGLKHVLRATHRPRLFFLLLVAFAFLAGHWSALVKVARKPAVAEVLRALPELLRALACTGVMLSTSKSGPMAPFCAMQGIKAATRAARYVIYERVSLGAFLAGGLLDARVSPTVARARVTVGMEAWCLLMLLPCAFKRKRFAALVPLLVAPCIALAMGGPTAAVLEPYLSVITQRLSFCLALMCLFMVFMGGFPTMLLCLMMTQMLIRIHKLDEAKF
mmetsp:Transcript_3701/g.11652  ORF Transcript_3701/g.11652 Transcript_3701/m.11652 type:complete len:399 (-) Transcript_3701:94-1290(-)